MRWMAGRDAQCPGQHSTTTGSPASTAYRAHVHVMSFALVVDAVPKQCRPGPLVVPPRSTLARQAGGAAPNR
jgi:hypothetical protein